MTLPNKLRERLETVTSDMTTDELVELSVACAQANATGEDVLEYTASITAVIVDRLAEATGDDILKLLIAFKQCRSVGMWAMDADFNTGILSVIRKEMENNNPQALTEWFKYDWNLRGFAAGMEDAAAVLASPGVLQILETMAAQWKEEIERNPEDGTPYYADALKTYRRIADAYKALIPAAQLWNTPADTHASLVASIAAAKHKETAGDTKGAAAQASGLISNFESMLNNPEAVTTLAQDQELMSSWMDSYVIMGAVWNSNVATETLLQSEVFRKELFKPDGVGNSRVGLVSLMDDHSAFQNIVDNNAMVEELCQSPAACKTLFEKPGAYTQLFESKSYGVPFKYPHASATIFDNYKICQAYVNARHTHPSSEGTYGVLTKFFESENMCKAVFDVPTVFTSILLPKAKRVLVKLVEQPAARKALFSFPRYYRQFLQTGTACAALFANADARKEAFAKSSVLEAIFESTATIRALSKNEIAVEELTRNHNSELQKYRNKIAYAVRNNEKGAFKKVYEGAESTVANLNAIVAKYPGSLVIATLGYATTPTDSTTMTHKNGVTAATGSDAASPQTVSTISGISFTGCTFTEQGDGHAAIEVWQA